MLNVTRKGFLVSLTRIAVEKTDTIQYADTVGLVDIENYIHQSTHLGERL